MFIFNYNFYQLIGYFELQSRINILFDLFECLYVVNVGIFTSILRRLLIHKLDTIFSSGIIFFWILKKIVMVVVPKKKLNNKIIEGTEYFQIYSNSIINIAKSSLYNLKDGY